MEIRGSPYSAGHGQEWALMFYELAKSFLASNGTNSLEVAWVPGHQDIPGNEAADQEAKEACKKQDELQARTYAYTCQQIKEQALEAWKTEWKNRPMGGRFQTANKLPPKMRVTNRFKNLRREIFGRTVQCRTGHAFVGEYYSLFNIPEDTDCPCGESFQTREHVIRECKLYEKHRGPLVKVSESVALVEILGTEKGIKALAEFLSKSGAFSKTGQPLKELSLPTWEEEPDVKSEDIAVSDDEDPT